MNTVGDLTRQTAAQAPAWAHAAQPTGRADFCSCAKPRGCWGDHGMHWTEYGEAEIRREVQRAQAALPMGYTDHGGEVERTTRARYSAYVGTPIAYMQCPAYYAELKKVYDARRADRERENGRRGMHLGDDL